ncbi:MULTISPECIES: DUF805 domain-containing protein [Pseudomonas]|uniref:DUF805 domain-containing protein n=1 Tax=Pseudomonas TaxID=286 RepID=UPI00249CF3CD|nr:MULTISPECIES: DUF805 domain-containing protein [Pseudomonas]
MTEARYKIVFDGQIMPDTTLETVKDNLARLFKSDRERIEALFGGRPQAIKRDLTEDLADKYLGALQRAGAQVRKEREQSSELSLVEVEEASDAAALAASGDMICPKCGHPQAKAIECSACGVVIEKYLARQAQLAASGELPAPAAAEKPATAPAATPYAPPRADVGETLPEFGELKVFSISGRIGRLRYLAWSLVMIFCSLGLLGVAALGSNLSEIVGALLIIVVMIGVAVTSVMIAVQRLHDIGWTGWLLLINLIPVVGNVFALLMLVVPGSEGVNRYGPPPPANSLSVKVISGVLIAILLLSLLMMFAFGGFAMLAMYWAALGS